MAARGAAVKGRDDWRDVSKREPCPICGKVDWCCVSADGQAALCGRSSDVPAGWRAIKKAKDGRTVYSCGVQRGRTSRPAAARPVGEAPRDYSALAERCRADLTEAQRAALARELGVRADALSDVGLGWLTAEGLCELHAGGGDGWTCETGAYTVPERDGRGRVVGLSLRAPNGAKGYPCGARRGLVVPAGLADLGGPVLAVKGASDVAACLSLGLAGVGRPSNVGGSDEIAELLREREVLVVGERDERDGGWPGRDGTVRVAGCLASAWRRPVSWTMPPAQAKDMRAWLCSRVAAGLNLGDDAACSAAGEELLAELRASVKTLEPPLTVRLAPDKYGRKAATLAVGEDGDELDGDDVLHVGRLRIAEPGDCGTWTDEATSAGLERAPWLGETESARRRIRGLLDAAVRDAAAEAASESDDEDTPSVAEAVVRLALDRYRLGVSEDGEPFAVEREGPMVALSLRGNAPALRAVLAREYRRQHGRTPSGSALADALTVLAGVAQEHAPEPVHLRAARDGDAVVLDLGDVSGRAVVADRDGWRVVDRSPVLFRRTALTAPMPQPVRGGDFTALWDLVPVAPEDRDLLLGWLLHATLAGEPHAIALLGGPQGAGKTTAAEYLGGLVDPSTAPTRSEPREPRQWAISASGSWLVALDNVSAIAPWLSDALCRAATGDGWVDRALYTDSELAVLRFQRVVLLTSIDAGALRGDLGDRIVLVDLARIPRDRRRPERELDARYIAERPRILGALLDVLVRVLRELPGVTPDRLPRMADFARVLAALDRATGSRALERYAAQEDRVAVEVAEGDPLAGAVAELGTWEGTATDLLAALSPEGSARPPRWLPSSPRALRSRLSRLVDTLRVLGTEVVPPGPTDRPRLWRIRPAEEGPPLAGDATPAPEGNLGAAVQGASSTVGTVGPSETGFGDPREGESEPTEASTVGGDRRSNVGTGSGPGNAEEADARRSDSSDGRRRPLDAEAQTPSTGPGAGAWTERDLADATRAETALFGRGDGGAWEDPG